MRFLMISYPPEGVVPGPPSDEDMAKAGGLVEEMMKTGKLVDTGTIQVPSSGTKVRYSGGKFTATDGPLTEAKELIAGFAIVEVAAKDEALAMARRFYEVMGDGEGEVLHIVGQEEMNS